MDAVILNFQEVVSHLNQLSQRLEGILEKLSKSTNSSPDTIYENEELCKILKISACTAQKLRDKGMIGFSQPLPGGKIYYRHADVEAFLVKYHKTPFKK